MVRPGEGKEPKGKQTKDGKFKEKSKQNRIEPLYVLEKMDGCLGRYWETIDVSTENFIN